MTLEQLNNLKVEESELNNKMIGLQDGLKDLFDLIPFGLAGETLMEVSTQLKDEKDYRDSKFIQEDVDVIACSILSGASSTDGTQGFPRGVC